VLWLIWLGKWCGEHHYTNQPSVLCHSGSCRCQGKPTVRSQEAGERWKVLLSDAWRETGERNPEHLCTWRGRGTHFESSRGIHWFGKMLMFSILVFCTCCFIVVDTVTCLGYRSSVFYGLYQNSLNGLQHVKNCLASFVTLANTKTASLLFWAISSASVSVRLWDFRPFCAVLSRVIRGRPDGLFQPSRGSANRIFSASILSSICVMPEDWETPDLTVVVRSHWLVFCWTSALVTNWYHLIPSSLHRHHWSRASIFHASTFGQ